MAIPQGRRPGTLPPWAIAGLLAAFAGATYLRTIRSVSSEDLEKELEREIEAEARKQAKEAAAAAAAAAK